MEPLVDKYGLKIPRCYNQCIYDHGGCSVAICFPEHKLCDFLGGGFKYSLFSTLPGEMIHFDKYLSAGLKPPTSFRWFLHVISKVATWRC